MTKTANELAESTIVGEWRIGKLLGRGGQGAVWEVRAVRVKHAPPRALKACFATDDKPRARFVREVELLQACASPLVLAVLEAHPTWEQRLPNVPPFAYYVAEKCTGALDDPKIELGDARRRLALFREACASVSHLHAMTDPVIHRDIKPPNFLLGLEPRRLVIADFGIARNELAPSDLTATHEVVGTQHFRAPEILNGAEGNVRADVYSLGRVLEWLLTGDISTDLSTRPVPRGIDLDDQACETLDRVIAKATQAIAANRYASVNEMVAHLPDLWITVRPRPAAASPLLNLDAVVVLPAALDLAQADDRVGWWRLEQQLRQAMPDRIKGWQRDVQRAPVKNAADLPPLVDRLLDAVSGRFAFGLAGVVTQQSGFVDQTRLIEDLLEVQSEAGRPFSFEAPRGLVYVFHHLHGALCCERNRHDLALQLATMNLPRPNRDEALPLWRAYDVTGWPELLGRACTDAWRYLVDLRERFVLLQELFALPSDYAVSLGSYSMLLSLVDFAHAAKKVRAMTDEQIRKLTLDVPPMFVELGTTVMRAAARRTFGNVNVVREVAERVNVQHSELREVWPRWVLATQWYYNEINRGFFGEWPVGDLA